MEVARQLRLQAMPNGETETKREEKRAGPRTAVPAVAAAAAAVGVEPEPLLIAIRRMDQWEMIKTTIAQTRQDEGTPRRGL